MYTAFGKGETSKCTAIQGVYVHGFSQFCNITQVPEKPWSETHLLPTSIHIFTFTSIHVHVHKHSHSQAFTLTFTFTTIYIYRLQHSQAFTRFTFTFPQAFTFTSIHKHSQVTKRDGVLGLTRRVLATIQGVIKARKGQFNHSCMQHGQENTV
jgi:hypothetical protein